MVCWGQVPAGLAVCEAVTGVASRPAYQVVQAVGGSTRCRGAPAAWPRAECRCQWCRRIGANRLRLRTFTLGGAAARAGTARPQGGVDLVLAVVAEGRLERPRCRGRDLVRQFDVVVTRNICHPRLSWHARHGAVVYGKCVRSNRARLRGQPFPSSGGCTGAANMIHDLAQKRLVCSSAAVRGVACFSPRRSDERARNRRQIAQAAPSRVVELSFLPVREAKESKRLSEQADGFFVVAGQSGARPRLSCSSRFAMACGPAPRAGQVGRATLFRGRGRPLGNGLRTKSTGSFAERCQRRSSNQQSSISFSTSAPRGKLASSSADSPGSR